MDDIEARLRAIRGAEYLDREWPGWANEINLDDLDMMSGEYYKGSCGCILAQLDGNDPDDRYGNDTYGDYCATVSLLGLTQDEETAFGFAIPGEEVADDDQLQKAVIAYEHLTAAWRAQVERRLTVG